MVFQPGGEVHFGLLDGEAIAKFALAQVLPFICTRTIDIHGLNLREGSAELFESKDTGKRVIIGIPILSERQPHIHGRHHASQMNVLLPLRNGQTRPACNPDKDGSKSTLLHVFDGTLPTFPLHEPHRA